jgi:hypothetical protein
MIPATTPNPSNFQKATLKIQVVWPKRSYPGIVANGHAIQIFAGGNKYPGLASNPAVTLWGNAQIETEYEITPVNGSPITRSCFLLPPGCSWVGSTGLKFRNNIISVGEISWPPLPPPHPQPFLPDGTTPAPVKPGGPVNPADNPNSRWDSACTLICQNIVNGIRVSPNPLQFTISCRFVVPTFQNQTVNWYYTPAGTSSVITVQEQYGPVICPLGYPTVSFDNKLTFPKLTILNSITRNPGTPVKPPGTIIPFIWQPPTNRFNLQILNAVNIIPDSVFYFRIIPKSGTVTADDFSGITWSNRSTMTWKISSSAPASPGAPIISTFISARGYSAMREQFAIEIVYYPRNVQSGSCTYVYPPIRIVTPNITILPSGKVPIFPTPMPQPGWPPTGWPVRIPPTYYNPVIPIRPVRPITPWPTNPPGVSPVIGSPGYWNGPVRPPVKRPIPFPIQG